MNSSWVPSDRSRRRSRVLAALLAAGLAGACSAPEPPAGPVSLTVLTRRPVVSLDPHTTGDVQTLNVLRSNVYETLVDFEADKGAVPGLAVSWSTPADDTWRFELRRGVRFHDGHPFGVSDVVATLERARTHPDSMLRSQVADIASVSSKGEHALEIRTRYASPLMLNALWELPILAAGSEPAPGRAHGTGPYRIVSWSPEAGLELARFEAHWRGTPFWQRALFRGVRDDEQRASALLAGEADLIDAPDPGVLSRLRVPGVQVMDLDAARITILGFLVRPVPGNPFADRELRRAISLAIDRRALVGEVLEGHSLVPTQLAPPGVFGYLADLLPLEANLTAAREALASSSSAGGVEAPLAFAEDNARIAQFVAEQAAAIGVRFRLEPSDWSSLDSRMQAQEVPAHLFAMTFPTLETGTILDEGFHTRSADQGVLNFSGHSDAELDAIVDEAHVEIKPGRRLSLLHRGMRRVMDAHVWLPLAVRKDVFAARDGLSWRRSLTGRIELEQISTTSP